MTRRFFDVANLCPPTVDGQHDTHQATSSFLTAALDDEVLMREETKKRVTHVRQSTAYDRGFLRHFFYPTPRINRWSTMWVSCAFPAIRSRAAYNSGHGFLQRVTWDTDSGLSVWRIVSKKTG